MIGNQIKVTEKNGKISVLKPELDTEKFFFAVMNEYREWYNESDNKPESLNQLSDLSKEFERINEDVFLVKHQQQRINKYLENLELKSDLLNRAKSLIDKLFLKDKDRGGLNRFKFPVHEIENILNEINDYLSNDNKITLSELSLFENYLSNCYQREIDIRKQSAINYIKFIAFRLNSIHDKVPAIDKKALDNLIGKPHNYKGELSEEAIQDLREFRKEKPDLRVNDFFKSAFNRYPSCRYLIKEGEKEMVKWGTIRDRVKENYPDIYYGNIETL